MDVRLTGEHGQLQEAAARLASELGPGSVQDLDDQARTQRLEKAVDATGWRLLRSDGASGVEVALVSKEFGRGLVDVPFLGPVLADELRRYAGTGSAHATLVVGKRSPDAGSFVKALALDGCIVLESELDSAMPSPDLTRTVAEHRNSKVLCEIDISDATRFRALALVSTTADLLGAARGAHALACEHARTREQFGKSIGSYQAVGHMLADGLALLEGATSVLRHAAWAVDELDPAEAVRAATVAKLYCTRAARSVCEDSIQVHGGIGNAWECLAHLYLRRVLVSSALFPVSLKEIDLGLS
jgi:hypothetical protein